MSYQGTYTCKYIKLVNIMHEKMKVKSLSGFQLFVTKWTVAYQASPSMGFSRKEYWSGLPLPSPGDLPDPGIALRSPALRADALPSEPPGKPQYTYYTAAKSLQSCLTLCDPMDCSPPGSSVHGILQARTEEWVAISFSRGSSWPRDQTWVSCVAGKFFTVWATREVPNYLSVYQMNQDPSSLPSHF